MTNKMADTRRGNAKIKDEPRRNARNNDQVTINLIKNDGHLATILRDFSVLTISPVPPLASWGLFLYTRPRGETWSLEGIRPLSRFEPDSWSVFEQRNPKKPHMPLLMGHS